MKNYGVGERRLELELSENPAMMPAIQHYRSTIEKVLGLIPVSSLKSAREEIIFADIVSALNQCNIQCLCNISSGACDDDFDDRLCSVLNSNRWDCDTLAFLIFDILTEIGIVSNIVLTAEHAYIKTKNGIFEPTNGKFYITAELPDHKKLIYYEGSDPQKIQAITYNVLGHFYGMTEKRTDVFWKIGSLIGFDLVLDTSLSYYTKAIQLIPGYAVAYNNRGTRHKFLGDYGGALRDYSTSISKDSKYPVAYGNRGRLYGNLYQFKKAIPDLEAALKLEVRPNEIVELKDNLAHCKRQLKSIGGL